MSYQVNFLDNQLVTADYLNSITGQWGSGALTFSDDMVYGVDDLNAITRSIVTKGVSSGCELTVGAETVTVGAGVLFMSGGQKVEIDVEGVSLPYEPGSIHYVWFEADENTGFVAPKCTKEAPTGDYVSLGTVTEDGQVGSHKEIAMMKNASLGTNKTEFYTGPSISYKGGFDEKLIAEVKPLYTGYRYVLAYNDTEAQDKKGENNFCGFVDLQTGWSYGILCTRYTHNTTNYQQGFPIIGNDGRIPAQYFNNYGNLHGLLYYRFVLGEDNVLRIYKFAVNSGGAFSYSDPDSTALKFRLF